MRHVQKGEIVSPPERPRIRINFIKVRQGKCSERLGGGSLPVGTAVFCHFLLLAAFCTHFLPQAP